MPTYTKRALPCNNNLNTAELRGQSIRQARSSRALGVALDIIVAEQEWRR